MLDLCLSISLLPFWFLFLLSSIKTNKMEIFYYNFYRFFIWIMFFDGGAKGGRGLAVMELTARSFIQFNVQCLERTVSSKSNFQAQTRSTCLKQTIFFNSPFKIHSQMQVKNRNCIKFHLKIVFIERVPNFMLIFYFPFSVASLKKFGYTKKSRIHFQMKFVRCFAEQKNENIFYVCL